MRATLRDLADLELTRSTALKALLYIAALAASLTVGPASSFAGEE